MKKEKTWVKKVLLLGIILAAVLVYILVPPVNSSINRVMKMFASGDFDVVREFVASYGAYAALASFLLMIFQSVAAPLPAFLLTLANANLFGWWRGQSYPGPVQWQEQQFASLLPGFWGEMPRSG